MPPHEGKYPTRSTPKDTSPPSAGECGNRIKPPAAFVRLPSLRLAASGKPGKLSGKKINPADGLRAAAATARSSSTSLRTDASITSVGADGRTACIKGKKHARETVPYPD